MLFWEIIDKNLDYAKNLIFNKPKLNGENEFLTFEEIKNYINKFNLIYNIKINLKQKNMVSRFLIVWNKMYLKHGSLVWKREIRSIIAHEIESHYLRKFNWLNSKYTIFKNGTANYVTTEEWIAIYNQNRFLTNKDPKYYSNKERYYFIDFALKHSYKETIQEFLKYYDNDYESIFRYLLRLKRWIKNSQEKYTFTKDVIYLNWYFEVDNFIKNWWDIKELYFWKIGLSDLEEIKKSEFLNIKVNDFKIPLFI